MKLADKLDYVVEKFKQIKDLETYADNLKKSGDYDDFETRLGWDCLRATVPSIIVLSWYTTYDCNDDHITTLVKKALKIARGRT